MQRAGLESVAVMGYVEAGLDRIALEQNQLDEAEQYINRLVEMSRAGDLVDITFNARLLLSRLRYYQGDLVGALAAARATQEAWRPSGIEWLIATCETLMKRPYLAEGKLTSAENSLARLLAASPHGDIETGLRFLLGWLVMKLDRRRYRSGHRVALVGIGALGCLGLVGLVAWQALRGQPLLSPDALTLEVFGGLVTAIFVLAGGVAWHAGRTLRQAVALTASES
ncbi:MAG TPA: hypothetical protein VH186_07820 [Chloroflexia bacterium]|nr:hypothetical protein [Chloroflexia bacterium]